MQIGDFLLGFITIQNVIAFVIGIVTKYLYDIYSGASAQYYGNKYTDKRRAKEIEKERVKIFTSMCDEMPEMLQSLRGHLLQKPYVRLFTYSSDMSGNFSIHDINYHGDYELNNNRLNRLQQNNCIKIDSTKYHRKFHGANGSEIIDHVCPAMQQFEINDEFVEFLINNKISWKVKKCQKK